MSDVESLSLEHAKQVLEYNVNREEVAHTYLAAELPRIAGKKARLLEKTSKGLWRTLEALSYSYRANDVFHAVTDESFDWHKLKLPIDSITLTGVKPHINDIVFSSGIDRQPLRFASYLTQYFYEHPDDDPEDLNEFRPTEGPLDPSLATLLTVERGDAVNILDGTHRLMKQAMLGKKAIEVYAGVPNGQESRHMIGDTTFLTLRHLFESADGATERRNIIKTTVLMARKSIDGYAAVLEYWIEHPRDPAVQQAGQDILDRLSQPDMLQ